MKIITKTNCGNSPKMEVLKNLTIAIAEKDHNFISDCISEDVVCTWVGDKKIKGKNEFLSVIKTKADKEISELIIEQILSHGKEGAVCGVKLMTSGERYAFSDFYIFKNAKGQEIISIKSHVIKE
jgi:hypothetical protein